MRISKFMKSVRFIIAAIVLVVITAGGAAEVYGQETNASLALFIKGGGSVAPLTNGQLLVVGQSYNMVATPDAGYVFDNWQPVNVFTTTNFVVDTNGVTIPVVSTVVSPMPP